MKVIENENEAASRCVTDGVINETLIAIIMSSARTQFPHPANVGMRKCRRSRETMRPQTARTRDITVVSVRAWPLLDAFDLFP